MEERYKKTKAKSTLSWTIALILAAAALVVAVLPFIFMVLNSFKNKFEMLTKGVFALRRSWISPITRRYCQEDFSAISLTVYCC